MPLAAFAHEPTDARSACVAVIQAVAGDVQSQVSSYRQLGAPVVIALKPDAIEFWKQREDNAELVEEVAAEQAEAYFQAHASELAPGAVFRAKTWGRLDRQFQLSFVDAGLMPVVEEEIGLSLTQLVERVIHGLRQSLWPGESEVSLADGHWLVKSAFWLLAAKVLRDKRVPGFITLDLARVEDVFTRVARHYDSRKGIPVGIKIRNRRQRDALEAAADAIARFSHLGHVTTESLAYVYESALITKETRASLGTHSTPQYLVDYLVWKLAPWINEIPENERDVFEPACGHAAFLVAAMRLLKELLPASRQADRRQYLRARLHGVEIDSFAMEIARLSLTLADIPNPNGWDLVCHDMFSKSLLIKKAQSASVVLGNPPFENFTKHDRKEYAKAGIAIQYVNKTAEVLVQILPQLRVGGVFGFVVPQGILHGANASELRHLICRDFEVREICRFPDKVFSFSDAESAIILGRRIRSSDTPRVVSYRRVYDSDMDAFRLDYVVSSKREVTQDTLCQSRYASFMLPSLPEVWEQMSALPTLGDITEVGEGLSFRSKLPEGIRRWSHSAFPRAVRGFVRVGRSLQTHSHPREIWMNISAEVLAPARKGADMLPQVLLNHVRASRGPWRIKAFMDREGHAFTNNYNAVRPKSKDVTLEFLWAMLNSALANAFAFTHASGRHNLPGVLEQVPVPRMTTTLVDEVTTLVTEYHELARSYDHSPSESACNRLRMMSLRLDALLLKECDLPPQTERQLLDLFAGHPRVGVPFRLQRYFPAGFEPWLHLYEYLSEEFCNSQASVLLDSHRTFDVPEVSEALRRATEDFEE